jgi:hypothetical protein
MEDKNPLEVSRMLAQYQGETGCAGAGNGTKCTFRCSCSRYNLEPATASGDDDPDTHQGLIQDVVGYVVRVLDLNSDEQWLVRCPPKGPLGNRTSDWRLRRASWSRMMPIGAFGLVTANID